MIEINHTYTLQKDWFNVVSEQFIAQTGAWRENDNLLVFPKEIAEGSAYCLDVLPGLFCGFILDMTFKQPLKVKRLRGDEELYVIHLDFSDEINLIRIEDEKHKIGYKANLGLAVFNNDIENEFQPVVGERVYTLRLLVAKEMLNLPVTKDILKKPKKIKNKLFFNHHIDSESKVILRDLKDRNFSDPAFDLYARGVFLKLLANFIDRYKNLAAMQHHTPDHEIQAVNVTKEFMLNNLFDEFPGIFFLAEMAGMSVTKYKTLFRRIFVDTPNNFFIKQKMLLAKELIKSGDFETIDKISKELNFKTTSYFSAKYYKQFGQNISSDFNTL